MSLVPPTSDADNPHHREATRRHTTLVSWLADVQTTETYNCLAGSFSTKSTRSGKLLRALESTAVQHGDCMVKATAFSLAAHTSMSKRFVSVRDFRYCSQLVSADRSIFLNVMLCQNWIWRFAMTGAATDNLPSRQANSINNCAGMCRVTRLCPTRLAQIRSFDVDLDACVHISSTGKLGKPYLQATKASARGNTGSRNRSPQSDAALEGFFYRFF